VPPARRRAVDPLTTPLRVHSPSRRPNGDGRRRSVAPGGCTAGGHRHARAMTTDAVGA
jgi:hypothetical protein